MGQFLCDRWLGRRRADRIAVRGGDADCTKADPSRPRRIGCVWHADYRPFRRRFAARVLLTREALFGVGAAALLLLFIGIHNAWDAVFYHVFLSKRGADDDGR